MLHLFSGKYKIYNIQVVASAAASNAGAIDASSQQTMDRGLGEYVYGEGSNSIRDLLSFNKLQSQRSLTVTQN